MSEQQPRLKKNPFQSFINKANGGFVEKPTESLAEADKPEIWVHYVDDESGYPYMYNTITGEARWLSEEQYIEQTAPIVLEESPWDKHYDDAGNEFYYNKITGESAWEIPAEEWISSGMEYLNNQPSEYHESLGLDDDLNAQVSGSKLDANAWLGDALGENIRADSTKSGKSLHRNSSLKSIRSARSFGLHSPTKAGTNGSRNIEQIADQINSQLQSPSMDNNSLSQKKSKLSFVINTKNVTVEDSLKPKSPNRRKSKSGFQMLKEGAVILSRGTALTGAGTWIEYQSSDSGPIFYAMEGSDGGQWNRPVGYSPWPTTTVTTQMIAEPLLDVAPAYNHRRDEVSTPSETSMEVVDFFAVDKDEVMKLMTPSIKSSLQQQQQSEPTKEIKVAPMANTRSSSLPVFEPVKEESGNVSAESSVRIKATPNTSEKISKEASDAISLKIKSVKAEAALELERLRQRVDVAKQSASSTRNSVSGNGGGSSSNAAPVIAAAATAVATVTAVSPIADKAPTIEAAVVQKPAVLEKVEQLVSKEAEKPFLPPLIQPQLVTKEPVINTLTGPITSDILNSPQAVTTHDATTITALLIPKEWEALLKTAHMIKANDEWECFYDLKAQLKFYRNKIDGRCQKDKPAGFNLVDRNNQHLKFAESPTIFYAHSDDNNNVDGEFAASYAAAVAGAQTPLTPKIAPLSKENNHNTTAAPTPIAAVNSKSPTKAAFSTSFLTSVLTPLKGPEEKLVLPASDTDSDTLQIIAQELAFVEKNASKAIRSQAQRRQHEFEEEAAILLKRLQALAIDRLLVEEEEKNAQLQKHKNSYVNTQTTIKQRVPLAPKISEMDKDDIRKLQIKIKKILDSSWQVLEYSETSPIEHIINKQQLMKSVLLQRKSLPMNCYDHRHDLPLLHFSSPALLAPSSRYLESHWQNQLSAPYVSSYSNLQGWVRIKSTSCFNSNFSHVYYHTKHTIAQLGEPFDLSKQHDHRQMKREKWADYEIKVSVEQGILEHNGIELWEDRHGGYLFYCPLRGSFSSNGIFEQISSNAAAQSRKTQTLRGQQSIEQQSPQPKQQNVWNQFNLKDSIDSEALMMSTTSNFGRTNTGTSTFWKAQTAAIITGSLDSADDNNNNNNNLQTKSFSLNQSLTKLKETLAKSKFDPKDVMLPESTQRQAQQPLPQSDNFSLLDEAFSIAKQEFETFALMKVTAAEEAAFAAGTLENQSDESQRLGSNDDENNEEEVDRSRHHHITRPLKFESTFSPETYSRYQRILLLIHDDAENPLNYFELLELLLYQGHGKAALAVFRQAIDVIKNGGYYTMGRYENALGQLLSITLSCKYFNYRDSYHGLLRLIDNFSDNAVILTLVAIQFMKLHHVDWAEMLFIGAVMIDPHYSVVLNQYGHLLFLKGEWRQAQRYLIRASESQSLWARKSKLEACWLNELLKTEDEAIIVAYKDMILMNASKHDRIQSLVFQSLGCHQQHMKVTSELVNDYYNRSLQADRDNGVAYYLYATALSTQQSLHKAQSNVDSNKLNKIDIAVNAEAKLSNGTTARPGTAGGGRPKSVTLTNTNTSRPSTANGSLKRTNVLPTLSTSSNDYSNNTNTPSVLSPLYNMPSQEAKHLMDSYYRRGLILMPAASSYHWIALLGYADFILTTMQDSHRALRYYEEAVKQTFSTEIWPIIAFGYVLQYVRNDYQAAKRLYTRTLYSRHHDESHNSRMDKNILTFTAFYTRPRNDEESQNNGFDDDDNEEDPFLLHSNQPRHQQQKQQTLPKKNKSSAAENKDDDCKLTQLENEYKVLYVAIAYLLFDLNEISAARRYALAALRIHRTYPPALRCISLLLYYQTDNIGGNKRLALKSATAAVDRDQNHSSPLACYTLAIMRGMKYQYDAAISLLQKCITIQSTFALAHRTLGIMFYLYKHQPGLAMHHLHFAFVLSNERDLECLRLKAQILMDQRQYKEARVCLLQCLELVPHDTISLASMGMCVHLLSIMRHPDQLAQVEQIQLLNNTKVVQNMSYDRLRDIAHSKDPRYLFSLALNLTPADIADDLNGGQDHHTATSTFLTYTMPASTSEAANDANNLDTNSQSLFAEKELSVKNYLYLLAGCYELIQGSPEALPRGMQILSEAVAIDNCLFHPMAIFWLGAAAEQQNDLMRAEQLYLAAVEVQDVHAVVLLRLISCIEDTITALKQRIREIKTPHTAGRNKAGKKKKKNMKGRHQHAIEASATFSDYTMMKSRRTQEEQDKIALDSSLFNTTSGSFFFGEDGGGHDDHEEADHYGEDGVPIMSEEMALLLRRVMLNQRVMEAAQLRKYSLFKALNEIDFDGDANLHTSIADKKAKKKLHERQIGHASQLEMTENMLKSFVYVDADFWERCLYASAKIEDWASLYESVH